MIQDIYPHKLDIAYRAGQKPDYDSIIIHFSGRKFLCSADAEGKIILPSFSELKAYPMDLVYLFALDEKKIFLDLEKDQKEIPGSVYKDISIFRSGAPKEVLFALTTAYHLSVWHNSNLYCGCCGAKTVHDEKERMLRCPKCGNMIYPKIMPSVIVGVRNGNSLLLTRYNRPEARLAALVAGFCEIGETAESTVRREVMEETGLNVKNIRYYGSQPWGITAGGLLLGFWCDVDGDDTIHVDGDEIAEAAWIKREDLSEYLSSDAASLTSDMIKTFASENEV